jgi:hypothetical protein
MFSRRTCRVSAGWMGRSFVPDDRPDTLEVIAYAQAGALLGNPLRSRESAAGPQFVAGAGHASSVMPSLARLPAQAALWAGEVRDVAHARTAPGYSNGHVSGRITGHFCGLLNAC